MDQGQGIDAGTNTGGMSQARGTGSANNTGSAGQLPTTRPQNRNRIKGSGSSLKHRFFGRNQQQ
jgi:hypothetical protein